MRLVNALCAGFLLALPLTAVAQQADRQTEVLWLGQAATRITTPGGKVIVIDPFLKDNPTTPAEYKDLAALGQVDLILVTHGHGDHVGDAAELSKATGAKIVGVAELLRQLAGHGLIEQDAGIGMNKGGTVTPLGPDIKITMVPADHSSGLQVTDPDTGETRTVYGGEPAGFVIELEDGFKIYHAGDTGVFGDMALIGSRHAPDLALVPIGGHYTMDPEGAAYAVRELIKPKRVLPIHYGTFPVLTGTPAELKEALGQAEVEMLDVEPGQALNF